MTQILHMMISIVFSNQDDVEHLTEALLRTKPEAIEYVIREMKYRIKAEIPENARCSVVTGYKIS